MEKTNELNFEVVLVGSASELTLGLRGPALELSPDLVVTSGGMPLV